MNDQNLDQVIEREVQRRVASNLRQKNDEIAELHARVIECRNKLVEQNAKIRDLTAGALYFGTILKTNPLPNPRAFRANDEVLVVDSQSHYFRQGGTIVSGINGDPVVDDDGCVLVRLQDGSEMKFRIGVDGDAQVRLSQKEDGTSAVISIDGKPWEVKGLPDSNLQPGDFVKVKPDSKNIIERAEPMTAGPICRVSALTDKGVEVLNKGEVALVFNPKGIPLEEGDRVACDHGMFCVLEKLAPDARQRYKVSSDLNVTWDHVGGLEQAKQELRDAIELPFIRPDLFLHYKMKPMRGILLHGPQGCGKTLLARVCVNAIACIHGKDTVDSGYIFVKGPEILDKWVGNTEAEIRALFERARRHYRQCGYKAILAIDEADAILPQRGTRRSSDVADTIVPMFLGEMDGIDEKQTEENPIVILMTNRADILDPAVIRPGRISRHIKVERPDEVAALDILDIHTKNMPFQRPEDRMATLAVACSDLFSKSRLLYRVNEHNFSLADAVNGGMLANLAEIAGIEAIHRDIAANTTTGVKVDDFRAGVRKVFNHQRGLRHDFDLRDFAERHGLQPENLSIERCFGAA